MSRLIPVVILVLTIGLAGGIAWLIHAGAERQIPTADTLRGAMP